MAEGQEFGGDSSIARVAAERAEAAEKAQEGAASRNGPFVSHKECQLERIIRAALMAAYRLAEEAKTHAKEAESVAAAKQYHAAHLSSILDGYL